MHKQLILITLLTVTSYCIANEATKTSFADIEQSYKNESDTTYIINFWATWCAPCIEELPDFQKAMNEVQGQKVKFIYISLDFPDALDRVNAFISKKSYQGDFYLLSDTDANRWINRINIDWEGNIPATLIINNNSKTNRFHSGILNHKDLTELITNTIQP